MIDRRFIFYPQRELVATPAELGLTFEDVRFPASDGVGLHGWYVPGEGDVTWLWFHGNGGNISHRLENLTLFHNNLGVNIFLIDYRGYGIIESFNPAGQLAHLARAWRPYAGSQDELARRGLAFLKSVLPG